MPDAALLAGGRRSRCCAVLWDKTLGEEDFSVNERLAQPGLRCIGPRSRQFPFAAFGQGLLLAVQQAPGDTWLSRRLRRQSQVSQGVPRNDSVLMVPEHLLYGLDALSEPLGGFAERGARRFGGVPRLLRRLAGLMKRGVAFRPRRKLQCVCQLAASWPYSLRIALTMTFSGLRAALRRGGGCCVSMAKELRSPR